MKTRRAMSDKLQFVVDPTMGALREPQQTEVYRTFSEEERMTAKERQNAEAIFVAALFLIVVPTVVEACIDGNSNSVAQWWDEGARFRQGCRCGYEDSFNRFWGDDLIGNLCHNYCHWVAGYTIPLWNGLTASWFGKAVLGAIAAIAGGVIYDLLKTLWKNISSDKPE